jgi:uncharacterized membrane protein
MSNIEAFLSPEDEAQIIEAIRNAEAQTSGEIRVHIESKCNNDPFEHALELFHELKMDNTKLQNGVLIYVAVDLRQFVIYGDKGINDVVPVDFWDSTRDAMLVDFKSGKYKDGLVKGIEEAGKMLSKYFPWEYGNTDELSNDISKG